MTHLHSYTVSRKHFLKITDNECDTLPTDVYGCLHIPLDKYVNATRTLITISESNFQVFKGGLDFVLSKFTCHIICVLSGQLNNVELF